MRGGTASKAKFVASGAVPFLFVVALVAYLLGPGSDMLDLGVLLPEVTIEQVNFVESEIQAIVRNTGPMAVEIAMADVNDRIQPAAIEPDRFLDRYETAVVRIPYEWNQAEPYSVGITTGDGTRFVKEVEAAAPALEPGWEIAGTLAVLGAYVGVIPVVIGMLWLPFIRRIGRDRYRFFLALTAGLLLFLGIDSVEEALTVSELHLAESFNGVLLVSTVLVLSFLGLHYGANRLTGSIGAARPTAVALMVAVGIGLHNFGEGLAIGAAIGLGQAAFSAFLIIGFALHNTTEGVAIAAPVSRSGVTLSMLGAMALVAGSPAIFGAWVGGFTYSPLSTVIFLSVGAGAIFQVITVMIRWMREDGERSFSNAYTAIGFALGMLVMYLTSVLV